MTNRRGQERAPREQMRVISLERSILEENDRLARENRELLRARGIYAFNLISAPGAGKTALLVETLLAMRAEVGCAVIEGDQQTSNDAQRIAQTAVPVVQINTGSSCHLEAHHVRLALEALPLQDVELLFIENVGNLTCPAAFDLGEAEKIVLMSVTEGEDKPAKYPLAFRLADLLVLTKTDLLPHLRFDVQQCREMALRVNPRLTILETSSYSGRGLDAWLDYLRERAQRARGMRIGNAPA